MSVNLVKELRERTGAGMMDCKAALDFTGGDMEKAIDVLRKKGMASVAKRAGREAKEGMIHARVTGQKAAIIEANCETDFVARTDDFKNLAILALEETLNHGENGITSDKVTQSLAELSGKIGEKLVVRRAKVLATKEGALFTYIHSNNKLGVLVEIVAAKPASYTSPDFQQLGKDLAMQVAASNPVGVARTDIPSVLVDREKAIYREEIKGKPEAIIEKIVQGKIDKFYQTSCLLEQPFIKDDKMSVQQLVDQTAKKIQDSLQVKGFVRFQLGENI